MGRPPTLPRLSTRASLLILTGLIAGSAVWRGLAARAVASPWIMPDELIYSSLARSFALTGRLAIRGVQTTGYSTLYPILLSGPFARSSPTAAYAAAKWENAVIMSLAAVPVFFLARRLLPNTLALLAAALALLVPSLAYTGVLMTENAFYPLFLLALVAMVRALERPTAGRQLVALAAILPAYLTRAEGIVLVPVFILAIALLALGEDDRGRELRRFVPTAAVVVGAVLAVVLVEVIRDSSPSAFLGTYSSTVRGYPLSGIPRWVAAQFAELELYLAFLPFVPALFAGWALLRRPVVPRGRRAAAAVATAAVVCTILLVAVFSAGPGEQAASSSTYPKLPRSLHERYYFYLVPLFLVFWLYWLAHRREFTNRRLALVLVPAILLPLTLPYAHVLTNADFEAFALLPWNTTLIAARNVPVALVVTAALLLPVLLIRRGSALLFQVGFVAACLWFVGLLATHQTQQASRQLPTSHARDPSWIDAAVPPGARVVVVWRRERRWTLATTLGHEHALWRAEFFNWSVERYFYVGAPMHYGLPAAPTVLPLPAAAHFTYVLAATPLPLQGKVIATDRKAGLLLYELAPQA